MAITLGIDSVCYVHTMKSKKMDLLDYLDKAVFYGAGSVQMDPAWPSQDLNLTTESLDYLHGLLAERNLKIVVKGNSGGLGTLANPPQASAEDIRFFCSKIDAAAYLGSPVVRVVTRAYPYPTGHTAPPPGIARQEVVGWVSQNLRKLAEYGEEKGVQVVFENHGDLRIAEIEHILDEVHSPWLGVQLDVMEQVAIFEDPSLATERLLPYALTVHWNDAYPVLSDTGMCIKPCLPGEGIIDLNSAFQKILALPQDVFVFTAFQAESEGNEDQLVKAYLEDLHCRLSQSSRKNEGQS